MSQREGKYQRNLNRYYNNGKGATDGIWQIYSWVQGYQPSFSIQAGTQTILNIIKSCIDTICSKMSQAKVRPFFNATRGDYKTIKACRNAQDFFDSFYEAEGVYKSAPTVLRDALTFDTGVFYVDDEKHEVRRVLPWNFYCDPAEWHYSNGKNLSRCMLYEKEYPFSLLRQLYPEAEKMKHDVHTFKSDFIVYYDLANKLKYYLFDREVFRVVKINFSRCPFVPVFWTRPTKGFMTTGLADELYTIQVQIDELQVRIDDATRNGIFNIIVLPEDPSGTGAKASMLTNKAALVVPYRPGPNGNSPPSVSTPPALNDQWLKLLETYIQKAYEIAGISQLSAQGKKPAGLNSGVALDTFEDIESERFNVILQNYIHTFVELAEVCIDVFDNNADVLPKSLGRAGVKWGDIKRQRDLFNIQFSAGSALAKDPAKKLEQIQQLKAMGLIPDTMVAQLLEIPDLETAYSAQAASYDYVQTIIQRVAETGEIDFLPIVDLEMLYSETVRWMNRLAADEENADYIRNLAELLQKIISLQNETEAAMTPPPPPPAPMPQGMGPEIPAGPVPPVPPPVDGGQVPPMQAPQPNQVGGV